MHSLRASFVVGCNRYLLSFVILQQPMRRGEHGGASVNAKNEYCMTMMKRNYDE